MTDSIADLLPPVSPCPPFEIAGQATLIAAAGFEARARAVCRIVSPSAGAKAILLDYRPYNAGNKTEEFRAELADHGWAVRLIEYNRVDPSRFLGNLGHLLADAANAVIDISAMSKLAIFLTLEACRGLDLEVRVVYSEAERYGPDKRDYERAIREGALHSPSIHSYTGVHGTVRVPPLSSVAMQGSPLAALVFMSFNERLTQTLLNEVYPSRLFLINGRPPKHGWREEATAWIHRRLIEEWPSDDNRLDGVGLPERHTSTLDYRETVDLLLELYWELASQHRIMVSPSGSKMQAVGAYVVWAMHPDIHIEYPTPKGYLPTYSQGIGPTWSVRFSALRTLVDKLATEDLSRHLGFLP